MALPEQASGAGMQAFIDAISAPAIDFYPVGHWSAAEAEAVFAADDNQLSLFESVEQPSRPSFLT